MRKQVALALVICGTLFALVPALADYLNGHSMSQFLPNNVIRAGATRVAPPMGESFRVAAWVLGTAMIGVGVLRSGGGESESNKIRNDLAGEFPRDMLSVSETRSRESHVNPWSR